MVRPVLGGSSASYLLRSLVLTALILGALHSAACSNKKASAKPGQSDIIPVRVKKVTRVERLAQISASGSVDATVTVTVAFQVAGRIVRLGPDEGGRVAAGDLLAEVDPSDYQYGVSAAEGQLMMAKATEQKARTGARKQEVERARAAFAQAEDEFSRMKRLFDRNALAPNDFKKIEARYLASKAQYEEALEGARVEDKIAASGGVEQAQAQLDAAKKRLSDTRVIAPMGGLVARRMIELGELAAPGKPACVIVNLNPAKVRVGVPEGQIGRVRAGQPSTVEIPSLAGQSFPGKVDLVGVAADPATRTFTVKISVPNPNLVLRDGMIAEARIQTDSKVAALTVPGDAVVRDPQGATLVYVYFPDQKRVYGRRVEIGTVYGQEVEVTRGLNGDEQIVTTGQNQVVEGSSVEATRESL